LTFVAASAVVVFSQASFAAPASSGLALIGGRVYPGPDEAPILDGTVVIERGKISAVGPRDKIKIPSGTKTVDCKGAVITAGFQNSHVHFTEAQWIDAAHQPASKLTARLQAMLTRYGITTAVETNALSLENTNALRSRIEAGEVAGPRILTAGWGLFPPDGLPFYLKERPPS
jgi:imidazolonepropionase-like amidohydrolase